MPSLLYGPRDLFRASPARYFIYCKGSFCAPDVGILAFYFAVLLPFRRNLSYQEVNTCNVNSFNISTGVDRATDTEHTSRPSSPEGPYCASGQGGMAPSVQRGADESALDLKPRSPSPGFPISHVLEFDAEARAERKALSARLSSDLGVPESTALAALEAFGVDTGRARQWLSMHLSKQVGDRLVVSVGNTMGRGIVARI